MTALWIGLAVALLAWYLTYSAARLDRLHHRVESSRAALEVQLARRAGVTLEVAVTLDPASAMILLEAAAPLVSATGIDVTGENDLTRALVSVFEEVPEGDAEADSGPGEHDLIADLARACQRVAMARRFHNDAVANAQRVRRKAIVRWARLAGHAAFPVMVELDDTVPAGLGTAHARPSRYQ